MILIKHIDKYYMSSKMVGTKTNFQTYNYLIECLVLKIFIQKAFFECILQAE